MTKSMLLWLGGTLTLDFVVRFQVDKLLIIRKSFADVWSGKPYKTVELTPEEWVER